MTPLIRQYSINILMAITALMLCLPSSASAQTIDNITQVQTNNNLNANNLGMNSTNNVIAINPNNPNGTGGGTIILGGSCISCFDFNEIAWNIIESISFLPGLIVGISYLVGIMMGFRAIILLKDHVEKPAEIPLRHSAIRFLAGGTLLALPIVLESVYNTVGDTANFIGPAGAWKVSLVSK